MSLCIRMRIYWASARLMSRSVIRKLEHPTLWCGWAWFQRREAGRRGFRQATADILLARVAWLPDSSLIALECMNRVQNQLDLLFCNPATGEVRKVLHEQSKTWINIADNFYPLHSRPEFLWTSERSGFRHIYRYGNDGKLLGQVTSGNWEVRAIVAVDEAHGQIDYTSSETSPLETQLYRVGFDGGPRTRLTSAGFTHLIHSNQQGSYYLDTYSSLKQPPQTVLRDADGRE